MSKWFIDDESGEIWESGTDRIIVSWPDHGRAFERIVREHNTHEEMVELLKSLRDAPYGLKLLHKLSEHACEGTIRDTWIPAIDAVLARAEGRE